MPMLNSREVEMRLIDGAEDDPAVLTMREDVALDSPAPLLSLLLYPNSDITGVFYICP